MLAPKKTKYRKKQKGRMKGVSSSGNNIIFGQYGLQAESCGWITARQIEAARITISRYVRKTGKMWIRIFPDKPITKKPAETRMGKGKGPPEDWVCVVKPGRVLFEVDGIEESLAKEALRIAGHKLPIKTQFLKEGEIR